MRLQDTAFVKHVGAEKTFHVCIFTQCEAIFFCGVYKKEGKLFGPCTKKILIIIIPTDVGTLGRLQFGVL